jgi:hypothetical protein
MRYLFVDIHGRDLEVSVRERGRIVCGVFTIISNICTGALTIDISHAV